MSLKLKYNPVGIKFILKGERDKYNLERYNKIEKPQRYCQFVKRASNGEFLSLQKGDFSCVYSEIVLGFKKPINIEIEKRLFLEDLLNILLFPANKELTINPDCIILIISPRNCADIIESYSRIYQKPFTPEINLHSGICSDITAHIIKKKDMNISFLCTGSRIYAGFDDCELVCGIPREMLFEMIQELIHIVQEREIDQQLANKI